MRCSCLPARSKKPSASCKTFSPPGNRRPNPAMAPSPRRAPAGIPAALDDSLGLLAGGVAPASGITPVDKNLVVPQRGRPGTWRLLDTVRAFATEQLQAAGEEAHAQERHLPRVRDSRGRSGSTDRRPVATSSRRGRQWPPGRLGVLPARLLT